MRRRRRGGGRRRQRKEDGNRNGSREEVRFHCFFGEGVTGESERDDGETKGSEEGTVRVRDAWFVCSLALHPA